MSRDWCFTSYDTEKELEFDKNNCRYICYGREECPTTGREHYQGFAIFTRTCRMPKAKCWIGGNGTHVEPRRGTRDEARDYCRKSDGEFFEWGTYDRITEAELFLKTKKWLLDNGYQAFFCRYYRAINERMDKGPKWRDVKVTWLWGKAGTGKTRRVMEMDSVFKIDAPYKWWDGYEDEERILIDDYEDWAIPRGQLLNLLDGYRQRLETKGGHVWAQWKEVYITSNKRPEEHGQWDGALQRRCDTVTECG